MANSRDGSQSLRETGTPHCIDDTGVTNTSAARGDLPFTTPPSIGQDVITSTYIITGIFPNAFRQVQESLQRFIEDAARQGISKTAIDNLTSPYQLSTSVVARDPKVQSEIVVPTLGTPQKFGRDRANRCDRKEYSKKKDDRQDDQTFGDQWSRWFDGLANGSIRNFEELIQAFTKQFMRNIQHSKSIFVLSTLGQRKDEKLKDYLTRFSQEVSEVHDPNDDAIVYAFVNSLQHSQLSLKSVGPTTYASLVDDVGRYTMTEEEQLAHEGERPTWRWSKIQR
ncbi:hypothetical protein Dsin_016808 [Dipteronia sinensis]|uniref:Retrotransposon gag domain-containing protein n=1 Tax=Dipteronia sinensis TaxID=43782 RepID=A0AAE0AF51_9ROSI|nr:hypothetical protein Dsin_016808 [Dipteronia sinensis]